MDVYLTALVVTGASILCGIVLINQAYKNPLG
jgi:hypothetical protein